MCYHKNHQDDLAEETIEKNLLCQASQIKAVDILIMIMVLAAKDETSTGTPFIINLTARRE